MVMVNASCYVAFPEVRNAILIATTLLVVAIVLIVNFPSARRWRRPKAAPTK